MKFYSKKWRRKMLLLPLDKMKLDDCQSGYEPSFRSLAGGRLLALNRKQLYSSQACFYNGLNIYDYHHIIRTVKGDLAHDHHRLFSRSLFQYRLN